MKKIRNCFSTIVLIALVTPAALADAQWYKDVYGTTNYNGQVTLTDSSGNPVTMMSNPTGTNVDLTQSSSIQPPVVIVQATASLPIKSIGDVCTETTTGTAPTQSASEGTAITADRTLLLSCQSGLWTAQKVGVPQVAMYLDRWGNFGLPISCPATWTELNLGSMHNTSGGSVNYRRTCLSPSTQSCSVVHFDKYGGLPSPCPTGWLDADPEGYTQGSWYTDAVNNRRACYKCS